MATDIIPLFGVDNAQAAEQKRKEEEVKKFRIDTEHARIARISESRKIVEGFEFEQVDVDKIIKLSERDDEALQNSLAFINPELSMNIPLIPGHCYIIGAISGTGKTTTCAAMVHAVINDPKNFRPVLVLSNEEKSRDFFARLACLELGYSHADYHYRRLSELQIAQIRVLYGKLKEKVFFVNSSMTRSVEGLQTILKHKGVDKFSAVFIDYFQGIKCIQVNAVNNDYTNALYEFKHFLTEYAEESPVPIVLFAQMKPMEAAELDRNIEDRIKWCKGIYEAGHFVIEAINIPKMMSTVFFAEKVRFGDRYKSYPCKFDKGRYVFLNPEEFEQHKAEMVAVGLGNVAKQFNEEMAGDEATDPQGASDNGQQNSNPERAD